MDARAEGDWSEAEVLGETASLCKVCLGRVPATVLARAGRVFLRKRCPAHGLQVELLEEDAGWYRRRLQFDKPGTDSARQTPVRDGCPFDCGLCPEHEQHTCIGLVEITGACDLRCPTCYAASGEGSPLPRGQVERAMDAFLAAEGGRAEVLQVSGGEPTTHPELEEILRAARARPFRYLMLNTNGLRLARDERLLDALAALAPGLEVYLQLDGTTAAASRALRGREVLETKLAAIEQLARRSVPVTLVMTAATGVNDDELGRMVLLGLRTPGVRGLNVQPLAWFGRQPGEPGLERLTLSGALRRIEAQTGGLLRRDDFVPLPCDVERVAVTYLVRRGEEFAPVLRGVDARELVPLIDNTLAFDTSDVLRKALLGLAGGVGARACCSFLRTFAALGPPGLLLRSHRAQARFVTESTFRISVTSFLDRFCFERRAAQRECVHVVTPDGLRIPFSAYNTLHRARPGRA
jgi:7,8-dihydro-6-hydroxymethylpterin dimethyltransferase